MLVSAFFPGIIVSMTSLPKKRGRKPKPFVCPWNNETVDGLYRCTDGRWRIVATGTKFSESDARLAVLRFRREEAKRRGTEALVQLPLPRFDSADDLHGAVEFLIRNELGAAEHRASGDDSLVLKIPANTDPMALLRAFPDEALWAHVRNEVIQRPQYVAQMTGIEQIGYLADIPKPVPSPTLDEVGNFFFEKKKKKLSTNWRAKCRAFWKEFVDFVAVPKLRDLTQEHFVDYADMIDGAVVEDHRGPSYARQRFEAIKSIINHPPKRGKWTDDCKRVHSFTAVLVKPEASAADPQPVSREDFHGLYNAANEQMKAILLVALNCCMYGGEAAALEWRDIDLAKRTVSTDRAKTRVVRIAVLWERTVTALNALPRRTEAVFITDGTKMQHNYQTVYKAFKAIRTATKLHHVQLAHIRDGAYTSACEADNVQAHHAEMLAGHGTGAKDRYVKRRPKMVAEACAAIERAYFD